MELQEEASISPEIAIANTAHQLHDDMVVITTIFVNAVETYRYGTSVRQGLVAGQGRRAHNLCAV